VNVNSEDLIRVNVNSEDLIRVNINKAFLKVWVFSEHFLVLNQKSGRLFILDELGAWILFSVSEGKNRNEILNDLQQHNLNTNTINSAIEEIEQLTDENSNESNEYIEEYSDYIRAEPDISQINKGFCFDVAGCIFQIISSNDNLLKDCSKLLSSLESKKRNSISIQFTIEKDGSQVNIYCNGSHITSTPRYREFMPAMVNIIRVIAYQSLNYLLAFHSAVAVKDNRGILLPGIPGSGKSTLSAGLFSLGYTCYSDEVSVLDGNDASIRAMPFPIAVKKGSWDVLMSRFPGLKLAKIWQRIDGKEVKYIQLPNYTGDLKRAIVKTVIFPCYDSTCDKTELNELNYLNALKLLMDAGYQIKNSLTEEKVEKVLQWITSVSCFKLKYSSLDEALQKIVEVI